MKISNFKDLMAGYKSAEIICPIKGKAMRELNVDGDTVHIKAGPDKKDVPIDTPVSYDSWLFDRGNLIFGKQNEMKLCTEGDRIRYPDGTEDAVYPADSIAFMAKAYNGEGSYSRKDK
jgi:hypothetical protein|tara:strand:- start:768 stop:1121 length:354 start_codon:yes stop_codon:yes gene_type:complete